MKLPSLELTPATARPLLAILRLAGQIMFSERLKWSAVGVTDEDLKTVTAWVLETRKACLLVIRGRPDAE